jgi:hypothetical protein
MYLLDRGNSLPDCTGELILLLDVFLGVKGDKVERESSEVLNILSTFSQVRQPLSNNVQIREILNLFSVPVVLEISILNWSARILAGILPTVFSDYYLATIKCKLQKL